ncbi:MAG: hypothetical protein IJ874_07580 [Ruminococcus sp.]|nr:hypothetical protein [Ruminococcus sp.]
MKLDRPPPEADISPVSGEMKHTPSELSGGDNYFGKNIFEKIDFSY